MGYTVLLDGSIRTDSADEAIAISARMRQQARPSKTVAPWPVPAPPAPIATVAPSAPIKSAQATLNIGATAPNNAEVASAFLRRLKGTIYGLSQTEMLELFPDVKSPRGLGSKTGMIKATLKSLGFEVGDAYTQERNPKTGTVFKAGPKIEAAIEACNREAAKDLV